MRFLENLVSDMIKDSTGINPRRLVRKIGGGKILLAGGAALAGALIAEQMSKRGGTAGASAAGASTTGAPPPLPPLPGSTPAAASSPPPLPPLPTAAKPVPPSQSEPPEEPEPAAGEEPELPPPVLFAVVRTMAAAALADGELTAEEREAIEGRLGDAGLAEEQIRRIHKDLVLPPGAQELAAMVADLDLPEEAAEEARETLYRAAAVVMRADRRVSDRERTWLTGLAGALGLAPERGEELTREVFG